MINKNIYQLVDGRHGRFLVNPRDQYIGKSLIAYGEWGEAEVRLFTQVLRPGDIAVEVGANIGSHTVPLSKAVGASGVVHVFEPQRLVYQLLCANAALNDCHNIHTHLAAVGCESGQVDICTIPPHHEYNYGAIRLGADYGGDTVMEHVPLLTLDSLNLPRVDFLKIDAEGYDLRVLQGAEATISRCRPFIFVEADEQSTTDITNLLTSNGYDCWWYFTTLFEKQNYRSNPENIWSYLGYTLASADMLAVPKEQQWQVQGLVHAHDKIDWGHMPLSADNFRTGFDIRRTGPDHRG
ncbi:FkbM family methyltransferase [Paraburkholderia solisilvae]|uniref:Methyltransferase FkbM domain-containing protein n=1 Tax=Paraburkholderia solisilvae TaxID=624376 RepID=A0A6J5DB10_9BURK|nr:FkbM family methyltransferase [Paraburkholderia solisilvae]CAB3751449.1 hypothetical protein LMG29739_01275 [Paraburkholderia solisilvae]